MRRTLTALLVVGVLAACSSSSDEPVAVETVTEIVTEASEAAPDPDASEPAEAEPTTAEPSEDETQDEPAPEESDEPQPEPEPAPVEVVAVPGGSGCSPGTPGTLPDGEWFGYLSFALEDTLEFDLACWYDGEDAQVIGAERGEPDPPNDFFIVNDNPSIRSLLVAPGTTAVRLGLELEPLEVSWEEYVNTSAGMYAGFCPGEFCTVWLIVDNGVVVGFREQFIP